MFTTRTHHTTRFVFVLIILAQEASRHEKKDTSKTTLALIGLQSTASRVDTLLSSADIMQQNKELSKSHSENKKTTKKKALSRGKENKLPSQPLENDVDRDLPYLLYDQTSKVLVPPSCCVNIRVV